jgi:hypothetical protein
MGLVYAEGSQIKSAGLFKYAGALVALGTCLPRGGGPRL